MNGDNNSSSSNEIERITSVYSKRDAKSYLYAWNRPDVIAQEYEKNFVMSEMMSKMFGEDLSLIRILDVGCGDGGFLRKMIEWGVSATQLTGVELLQDRLDMAKKRSPDGITWHHGLLDEIDFGEGYDLVSTHTVFSSILDDTVRGSLANEMWKRLRPGGWIMVFDMRVNNPANPDIRKTTKQEMQCWWHTKSSMYQTLILAPPLARKLTKMFPVLSRALSTWVPVLRTHFIYCCQKPKL